MAGLTPEMISQALQFKFAQEELGQKKLTDLVEQMQKAEDLAIKQQAANIATFNALTKDERTALEKEHDRAKREGFAGGIVDFKNAVDTGAWKDYQKAVEQGFEGTFQEWKMGLARAAGGIDDYLTKRRGAKDIDIEAAPREYFAGRWRQDIEKKIEDDPTLDVYYGTPKYEVERARSAERHTEGEIISRGGKIVEKKLDGRTFVWVVQWPDGTTSEVRYAN